MGTDLYPTFLDASGVSKPDHVRLDGVSLLPYLVQSKESRRLTHFNFTRGASSKRKKSISLTEKISLLKNRVAFWLVDYEHPRNTAAYMHGYKIIMGENHFPIEVFHLPTDPKESKNLVDKYKNVRWNHGEQNRNNVFVNSSKSGTELLDMIMHTVVPHLQNFSKFGNVANFLYLQRNYGLTRLHNHEDEKLVPAITLYAQKCDIPKIKDLHMLPFEAVDKLGRGHSKPLDY
jgi:hypothetical protein